MTAPLKTGLRAVPRSVWAIGFVSMFMDVSSEMIHSLLPVFLVTGLGASVALVGLLHRLQSLCVEISGFFFFAFRGGCIAARSFVEDNL